MYAISFDLTIGEVKKNYGEPYNNAYFEIRMLLKKCGFEYYTVFEDRKPGFMKL